ncbi:hypothetical protein AB0885_38900, partial [Streptomyces sp. NPDC005534]
LRGMARPSAAHPDTGHASELTPPGRILGGTAPASPPGGMGVLYPPVPAVTPGAPDPGAHLASDPDTYLHQAR